MKSIKDPDYVEMIARLRTHRVRERISQATLAARIGKTQSYVAKVETGERRLDLIETLKICDALGVSLDRIVPISFRHVLRSSGE